MFSSRARETFVGGLWKQISVGLCITSILDPMATMFISLVCEHWRLDAEAG